MQYVLKRCKAHFLLCNQKHHLNIQYLVFKLDNSGLLPREGIVCCQSTGAEYRGESDRERGLQWHHDGTEVTEGGNREIRKVSLMAAGGGGGRA